jgi:hypothetical protein
MKLITTIFTLFCASSVFSENLQVNITPEKSEHAGVRFAVFTEPQKLMHDQFRIFWVVIAITPADKNTASSTAHVDVWDDNQFVYAHILQSCKPDDIPDNLKKQINTKEALLFWFSINPMYLKKTWFSYQIARNKPDGEPTDCVIQLGNFIKPNQVPVDTAHKLADPQH